MLEEFFQKKDLSLENITIESISTEHHAASFIRARVRTCMQS